MHIKIRISSLYRFSHSKKSICEDISKLRRDLWRVHINNIKWVRIFKNVFILNYKKNEMVFKKIGSKTLEDYFIMNKIKSQSKDFDRLRMREF